MKLKPSTLAPIFSLSIKNYESGNPQCSNGQLRRLGLKRSAVQIPMPLGSLDFSQLSCVPSIFIQKVGYEEQKKGRKKDVEAEWR